MKGSARRALRRGRLAAAQVTSRVIGPAERRAAAGWRADVAARGTDRTDAVVGDPRPLLVVAPHPDDETIGCAVLMARRRDAGHPVTVVVASDGGTSHRSAQLTPAEVGELRRAESRTACASLGVNDVRFLGYDEQELRDATDRLVADLAAVVRDVGPGRVAVPYRRDWHPEHVIVHDAAVAACRTAGFAGTLCEYPVWSWHSGPAALPPMSAPWRRGWALTRARRLRERLPTAELVSTEGYAARKRAAFACYRTQVTSYTGEDTWQPFPEDWIDPFTAPWEAYLPHRRASEG